VGYAMTTQWDGKDHGKLQMIGFDMGGTSTDVSRFAGEYEHVFDSTIAGRPPSPSSIHRPLTLTIPCPVLQRVHLVSYLTH